MRILCIPYTHTLSHISRLLVVAKELKKRGHEVIFAGASTGEKDRPKDKFIKDEDFDVLPLYQIKPEKLFGRIRDGKLKFVHDDEIKAMIEADLQIFKEVKPDLVLTDGRFSAPISTSIASLKHAAIVNVSSTEYRALPYIPFFEWIPCWLVRRNSFPWNKLDLLNLKLEMLVFDNAAVIFNKLSKKHHLKKTVTATNCLTGKDLTLLADIEEYFPTRNLTETYHYIGPLTWESHLAPPKWWPPKRKNKTLVYITMGTTWMGGSFEILYRQIKKSGLTAIITTGGQIKEGEAKGLKSVEGELYIEEYINGDMVMKECDLVICHGGNGTIYQALQNGKPIIGIPTIPDQEFNMRRVEALGVGKKLSMKDFSRNPEALFNLIHLITVDSSYSRNAREFQRKLSKLQPAVKAADLIEQKFPRVSVASPIHQLSVHSTN